MGIVVVVNTLKQQIVVTAESSMAVVCDINHVSFIHVQNIVTHNEVIRRSLEANRITDFLVYGIVD